MLLQLICCDMLFWLRYIKDIWLRTGVCLEREKCVSSDLDNGGILWSCTRSWHVIVYEGLVSMWDLSCTVHCSYSSARQVHPPAWRFEWACPPGMIWSYHLLPLGKYRFAEFCTSSTRRHLSSDRVPGRVSLLSPPVSSVFTPRETVNYTVTDTGFSEF